MFSHDATVTHPIQQFKRHLHTQGHTEIEGRPTVNIRLKGTGLQQVLLLLDFTNNYLPLPQDIKFLSVMDFNSSDISEKYYDRVKLRMPEWY